VRVALFKICSALLLQFSVMVEMLRNQVLDPWGPPHALECNLASHHSRVRAITSWRSGSLKIT
jgi:hypothetical protein